MYRLGDGRALACGSGVVGHARQPDRRSGNGGFVSFTQVCMRLAKKPPILALAAPRGFSIARQRIRLTIWVSTDGVERRKGMSEIKRLR